MAPTRGNTPTPPGRPARGSGLPSELVPAGLGRRLAALMVDWLLSVLLSSAFADPRASGWPPVAILIVEYTIFIGLFGQTPGMFVARIRCVSAIDGGAIGMPRALLRGVLLALVVPALIMDESRRGLHDKAANSTVLTTPTP